MRKVDRRQRVATRGAYPWKDLEALSCNVCLAQCQDGQDLPGLFTPYLDLQVMAKAYEAVNGHNFQAP